MSDDRLEIIFDEMKVFINELENICEKDEIDIFDILKITYKHNKINNAILRVCIEEYCNMPQTPAAHAAKNIPPSL